MPWMPKLFFLMVFLAALSLIAACGDDPSTSSGQADDDSDDDQMDGDDDDYPTGPLAFRISSSAFEHLGSIPSKYSCDGENISPPLAWENVPEGTMAFALTVRDPDSPSGDTKHWGLINIPGDWLSLDEGINPGGEFPEMDWETLNYRDELGYAGPCPPAGENHRYRFTLYALDHVLGAPDTDLLLDDVLGTIEETSIESTTLTGRFARESA